MTYALNGLIQASDYNGFANSVNAIWGAGSGDSGYGQGSTLATVAATNTVTAAQWATLIARLDSIRRHQAGAASGSGLTQPVAGDTITFLNTLSSVITTATNNRNACAANGTTVTITSAANAATWVTTATREATLTFASAAAMRYYFNAGGYVQFSGIPSTVSGNTKSTDWDTLLNNCGSVRIFNHSSDRISGTGTTAIYNTNLGFWDLTTSNQVILRQYSPNTVGGYNLNYATFQARLNAAPGSSTVLTVSMVLTDASGDVVADTVGAGVYMQTWHVPPSTTYISNTWGTPTLANSTNTQS